MGQNLQLVDALYGFVILYRSIDIAMDQVCHQVYIQSTVIPSLRIETGDWDDKDAGVDNARQIAGQLFQHFGNGNGALEAASR